MAKSQYELEREANIAKNRELFANLGLQDALDGLGIPKAKQKAKSAVKPVQSNHKKRTRQEEVVAPRRSSRRLASHNHIPENETPAQRKRREKEEEEEQARLEAERLDAEERARAAKRPRHDVLDFIKLVESEDPQSLDSLLSTMKVVDHLSEPRVVQDPDDIEDIEERRHQREVTSLQEKLESLKVIARAKVTQNRIYCAAYHPEPTKDLIFFGDKYGQLGIWDARAPQDRDDDDDDDDDVDPQTREGGKYWNLQLHWPANAKSSISCVKMDPINTHNIYTSAYDCTIRSLSFVTGNSTELYASSILISCIDLPTSGREMWVSDVNGGVTHLDLRESNKQKVRRYELSSHKIGTVSVNPTEPNFLLTSSNSRLVKVWDVRNLHKMPVLSGTDETVDLGDDVVGSSFTNFSEDTVLEYADNHSGTLRGEAAHDKSASSAYWDPRGRSIVSTSYDDRLRLWSVDSQSLKASEPFESFKPFSTIKHDCQTGRWLTILRAQWSPNPDAYPHFTVGNMQHSLDIYSHRGDLIAALSDRQRISAVQAVTCSHPRIVERAASGNASGRCVLWAPESEAVL